MCMRVNFAQPIFTSCEIGRGYKYCLVFVCVAVNSLTAELLQIGPQIFITVPHDIIYALRKHIFMYMILFFQSLYFSI